MNRNLVTVCLTALVGVVVVLGTASVVTASQPERIQGASAPTVVSYQGQVKVGGVPYNGTGYFKFAILNGLGAYEWTNDGSALGGGEPTASVSLTVSNGLFNVLLGDTLLTNMTELPASVFDDPIRYLRIYFSIDNGTFTRLSPDQRIASVPYALQAEKIEGYANVVVVAKSGGDYTTISGALDSITTASDSNRYLIKVMPGVYTEQVFMKEYVDIKGSGELNTRITYTGSSTLQGTLEGANNAELRSLTVENTGGALYTVAIYNNSNSPHVTKVTAIASGGTTNYGVYNNNSSSPVMTDVSASASGGSINYGVYNNNSSSPVMTDVSASASGGINYGVHNYDSSSPVITNLNVSASGGTHSYGVYNHSSSTTIRNSVVNASGATTHNSGIFNLANDGEYTVVVDNSKITASTGTIMNDAEFITSIGASLLSGGSVFGAGPLICAGVYDENYTFYASTCP